MARRGAKSACGRVVGRVADDAFVFLEVSADLSPPELEECVMLVVERSRLAKPPAICGSGRASN